MFVVILHCKLANEAAATSISLRLIKATFNLASKLNQTAVKGC